MLVRFFLALRAAGVPASPPELLTLHQALTRGLAERRADRFYALARACLVKDERHYDRFDRVFAAHFAGAEAALGAPAGEVPGDWLERLVERHLSPAERARARALGGFEELLRTLEERLREQSGRHAGGSKWIGTGGTSPFGAHGAHPQGVRFGASSAGERSAAKVWERREFRDLADDVDLGTRGFKLALRRLRRFAREGAAVELSVEETVSATASSGGLLDLRMLPERRNAMKVLLLLDVGGSMDDHVGACERLFSAARSEFKHLEHYYFHNCVYEGLWRNNRRRRGERIGTMELLRTYASDYRLILVGDAAMSPYEITEIGGSVEHWNEEPGRVWLARLVRAFPRHAWLNPAPLRHWQHTRSIGMVRELLAERMYPLTLEGLERAIDALR